MHLTVGRKVLGSLALLTAIGTIAMGTIYYGLQGVDESLRQFAEIEEPINAAAYEMEVNISEIGLAILKYLDVQEDRYRALFERDQRDFEAFHAKYVRLVRTDRERQLAESVGVRYRDFKALGERLVAMRAAQEALFASVVANFNRIDDLIDDQLDPIIDRRTSYGNEKVYLALDMEADIAEMGLALANYQRLRRDEHRERILRKDRQFRRALTKLKNLPLTPEEGRVVGVLERILDETTGSIHQILATEAELRSGIDKFVSLNGEMDRLLDQEIQPLALARLRGPRERADQASGAVLQRIQILVPLFALAAIVVGVLLVRTVTRPVRELVTGTAAVSRGDLSHRLARRGNDEFADLADRFNAMVAQLEATTVSKARLEESQHMLQETVGRLRQEIADRRRADEERARLEASLRRAQQMSAMGSLLAGVAHEVRTPLFGVSAILDAMEARLGAREEYRRYTQVLRVQVDRLTALIQELLEYGRTSAERLPGVLEDVITEATEACRSAAKLAEVEIVTGLAESLPALAMDRTRLVRAFKNLLENAIQHSAQGGVVKVEAAEVHDDGRTWIECTVKDSGPGIPADDLERIFDPFFSRRRGGTGLGLSIVQRIVEEHRGMISAGSRPEGGAVITLRLPVTS